MNDQTWIIGTPFLQTGSQLFLHVSLLIAKTERAHDTLACEILNLYTMSCSSKPSQNVIKAALPMGA